MVRRRSVAIPQLDCSAGRGSRPCRSPVVSDWSRRAGRIAFCWWFGLLSDRLVVAGRPGRGFRRGSGVRARERAGGWRTAGTHTSGDRADAAGCAVGLPGCPGARPEVPCAAWADHRSRTGRFVRGRTGRDVSAGRSGRGGSSRGGAGACHSEGEGRRGAGKTGSVFLIGFPEGVENCSSAWENGCAGFGSAPGARPRAPASTAPTGQCRPASARVKGYAGPAWGPLPDGPAVREAGLEGSQRCGGRRHASEWNGRHGPGRLRAGAGGPE
ncbi:hypothetical protein H4W79_003755 [Nocardiopsis terrae]|uniref:Uncharacterized protein n=1 Tax=Nocardiopsis terrae TaxID=372655 RepID=A0ABR9HKJ4_9ACTN|nr:hypothetical protein [Nocardiopsis terrae]